MNIKYWSSKKKMAIIISVLLIVTVFLILSQMYFTYSENIAIFNGCYDKGGIPNVEKTGFILTFFDCNMKP